MHPSIDPFLSLIRLGVGHSITAAVKDVDWTKMEDFAAQHGLSAVLIDGIEKLPENCRPPKELLLQWIGECLQSYEYRYDSYRRAIAELASFYNTHELKMMIIKGYACGLDWPKPEHRPYGDIDIWQFGEYKKGDSLLEKEKGIEIDNSHHHHTVFNWGEFSVENHYDFNNVHHHKSSAELEKIFKELGQDDTHYVEMMDASTGSATKVYLPSPNLHALFLIKHSMTDFAAFYVTLRQVLDWGFFVEKHGKEIDWGWLQSVLDKFHMKEFFNCINAICVEDLGFSSSIFPNVQFNPFLKEKVLSDILEPKFTRESPRGLVKRLVFKYRRWKGNAWKHELCYNESLWSAFWSGVWNHLLKPKTI